MRKLLSVQLKGIFGSNIPMYAYMFVSIYRHTHTYLAIPTSIQKGIYTDIHTTHTSTVMASFTVTDLP